MSGIQDYWLNFAVLSETLTMTPTARLDFGTAYVLQSAAVIGRLFRRLRRPGPALRAGIQAELRRQVEFVFERGLRLARPRLRGNGFG